jgi:hypothetical protein
LQNQSKSLIGVMGGAWGQPESIVGWIEESLLRDMLNFRGLIGILPSMPWLKVMKGCENVFMLRDGGDGDSSDIGC